MAANNKLAVALHLSTVLACTRDRLITSDILASSINLNPVAVRRIVADLVAAHLVESRRGKHGGLKLARCPSEITLWDIYAAVEPEPPFAMPPKDPDRDCPVGKCMGRILSDIFADIDSAIEDRLRRVHLSDLRAQVPIPECE